VLASSWDENSASRGRACAEIALSSGWSQTAKDDHAQAEFARPCGLNSEIRGIADADIEVIRGVAIKAIVENAHERFARPWQSNWIRVRRAWDARDANKGD